MNEDIIIRSMKDAGISVVASLPCDRNKVFTKKLPEHFRTVDLTREEDGIGICAGAYLMGERPIMSIQSSGIGNMLNAMMSLTSVYKMPLPILASWRGMENEPIEAQVPFNSKIPDILDAYGIDYRIIRSKDDLHLIGPMIDSAFELNRMTVALIMPSVWTPSDEVPEYNERARNSKLRYDKRIPEPKMFRIDAIRAVMDALDDDTIVISNIGVPSKELYAVRDRPRNFYMLGSYTQATPIGLGMAMFTDRRVVVLDGDGSLLGSSVLTVVAAQHPENLTIVCLDNGTFGSTGNQITPAYADRDMELIAKASGIKCTDKVSDLCGIVEGIRKKRKGTSFIHVIIRPGNSGSQNIPMSAEDIKNRFMDHV